MALVEMKVPDIGDFDEVTVIELLVKPGDTVKAEQSPDHGRVRQGLDGNSVQPRPAWSRNCKVKLGDKVKQGSVVLVLEAAGDAAAPAAPASEPKQAAAPAAPAQPLRNL